MTSGLSHVINALTERFGGRVKTDVALRSFTTLRLGGPADVLLTVLTLQELLDVAVISKRFEIAVLVIGQGSNLLVADDGYRGLVIMLDGEFTAWSAEGNVVTAGAAMKMPVLARQTAKRGLAGLEWMVGVPGSIGGAVCMNAGGHGSEVASNFVDALVVDLQSGTSSVLPLLGADFSYRSSSVESSQVVAQARFQCSFRDSGGLEQELAAIVRWRREHQPGGANCGSVFRNPPGDSAGRLIDEAGLRGFWLGTAQVAEKHANFIQASDGTTASDAWGLIAHVRNVVFQRFGIVLHPEVRTIGLEPFEPLEPAPLSKQPSPGRSSARRPSQSQPGRPTTTSEQSE